MKIAIAQNNYKVGAIEENTALIIKSIEKAKQEYADIVVFSELCICGYPPYDLLNNDAFIEACSKSAHKIAQHTDGIAVILGLPEKNTNIKGKALFNAAYFIYNNQIVQKVYKSLLPDYDVFDECRYFEPSEVFHVINFKGKKIALTICEDLWNIGNEGLYKHNPMEVLFLQHPDIIINIAASPFDYKQQQTRLDILRKNVLKYKVPLVYVNQVGAQTDLIFDGSSLCLDSKSNIIDVCDSFKEDFRCCNLFSKQKTKETPSLSKIELMHNALVLGIKDYFNKSGIQKAVLGLSGGIDSALVYALAVRALGNKNVVGLVMPSQFSSAHSVEDAIKLAKNLDGRHEIIPINTSFEVLTDALKNIFANTKFDTTEENIQARIRAVLLMAYSNKFGHLLLNTSNKSEAAVGYGTLYGDMCGGLAVIADLYKTEVYEMSHFINKEIEIIPANSITKAPSAELRPNQSDSDSLPNYDLLDEILHFHIEQKLSSDAIKAKGFDAAVVNKILSLVSFAEYKRAQSPPVLRVSPKAFGCGRKMPIVASYKTINS